MISIRSLDLTAWPNYVDPGFATYRGIDQVGDCWPDFRMRTEDDVTLADYLSDEDRDWDEVLTGESEIFQRSWAAHTHLLPFAFDLIPWVWSRQDPQWWVRIQYAEVIDHLRIETWAAAQPRRIIRISSEMPWVLHGEPYSWELPFWEGRQPGGSPAPLTLVGKDERIDLTRLFVLKGGARGVAGGGLPREYDADRGTVELRDGRVFWRGLRRSARATEYAQRLPGSFVDEEGLAHIDLESANLTPDPSLATAGEEWPDVEGLFTAAMENLLGIRTMDDLDEERWTGLLLGSQPRHVAI